jgi:tetratricopeptide (TPR) repeat protein
MEFDFGLPAVSRATLMRISNPESVEPDLAILRAKLGDASFAEHYLAEQNSKSQPGTQMAFVNLPLLEASLAEQRGKPLEAVAALEPTRPYELADYSVLSLRAAACLKAGQPDAAADAYNKILANPGVDPLSPLYPLAHLGLARADALKNDRAASRSEYEKFFALWKDADADIPVLKNARSEYSGVK